MHWRCSPNQTVRNQGYTVSGACWTLKGTVWSKGYVHAERYCSPVLCIASLHSVYVLGCCRLTNEVLIALHALWTWRLWTRHRTRICTEYCNRRYCRMQILTTPGWWFSSSWSPCIIQLVVHIVIMRFIKSRYTFGLRKCIYCFSFTQMQYFVCECWLMNSVDLWSFISRSSSFKLQCSNASMCPTTSLR